MGIRKIAAIAAVSQHLKLINNGLADILQYMLNKMPLKTLYIISILATAALAAYHSLYEFGRGLSPASDDSAQLTNSYLRTAVLILFTFVVIPFLITAYEVKNHSQKNQPKVAINAQSTLAPTVDKSKVITIALISIVLSPIIVVVLALAMAAAFLIIPGLMLR